MLGVTFPGQGRVALTEVPDPIPGPGEVVVRVRASGMCGSDLHFLREGAAAFGGRSDTVQGHEPCGEVHAVGPGVTQSIASVGDRVMVHHYWGCEACDQCRTGWPQMCDNGAAQILSLTANGGHAPYMLVPARTLLPLPIGLSFKAGAAVGCGTGTAWGGLRRLGTISGETIVVFGQGPVGLSGTMLAAALGAHVIAVDPNEARREKAREFGAREVVDSNQTDLIDAVAQVAGRRGVQRVLETSGRAAEQALQVLGKWGRACFVGLPGKVEFSAQSVYKNQWTLMTSWTMSTNEQLRCAEFIVDRKLPVDEIFSHRWSLDEAGAAYEWLAQAREGKGVFEM